MTVKHALIGGGTGFIGSALSQVLRNSGYEVTIVSRMPGQKRITWLDLKENGLPSGVTSVINVAGQNVLEPSRRWTPGFKQNVWNSRINSTASLVQAIKESSSKPAAFVNVSGVSLYPPGDKVHTEEETGTSFDFMSRLCIEWEKSATLAEANAKSQTRVVKVRTGAVIGRNGGMIGSLMLPFLLGVGGPIGDGKQTLPWIHMLDLCNLIKHAIENEKVEGVLNGVAPQIITNGDFTKAFASALRRPAFFPTPEFVFKLIFGDERSVLLLTGAKIKPKRVLEYGFKYSFPDIESACKELRKK